MIMDRDEAGKIAKRYLKIQWEFYFQLATCNRPEYAAGRPDAET